MVLNKSAGVGCLNAQRLAYSLNEKSNNSLPIIVSRKIFKPVPGLEYALGPN